MANPNLYTVGGTVQAGGGIYIPRQADEELLQLCREQVFAYVLTPRQMGKSSLMVRTAERLREEGARTAIADLQELGVQLTAEQWYLGFLVKLEDQLELETSVVEWWQGRSHLGVAQRLTMFFEQVLLVEIGSPVVIFVDEIDSTLSLDFTDDFFIAVRSLYVARSTQPLLKRLSFVLVGVATPGELIADAKRTPFNIGHPVEIEGFRLAEALPLAQGLMGISEQPEQMLKAVLDWTGGQPFLTQKVCQMLQSFPPVDRAGSPFEQVEEVVRSRLIDNWEEQDNPAHLKTIRDRLLRCGEQRRGRLLGLYQQVSQDEVNKTDHTPEQMGLLLSGLVVEQSGKLKIYNRIYEMVFSQTWVTEALADLRPYAENLEAWEASERQDESRLLRNETLQEAQAWAATKNLGVVDYQFLAASQAFQLREVEQKLSIADQSLLEIQQETEHALVEREKIQHQLRNTKNTLNTSIRNGLIGVAGTSIAVIAINGLNSPSLPIIPLQSRVVMYAKPAVVKVQTSCTGIYRYNSQNYPVTSISWKTGFFISPDGYIVTSRRGVNSVKEGEKICKERMFTNLVDSLAEKSGKDPTEIRADIRPIIQLENFTHTNTVVLPSSDDTSALSFPYTVKGVGIRNEVSKNIAIIKVEVSNAPTLQFADSSVAQLQDPIMSVGYPTDAQASMSLSSEKGIQSTVLEGIISNPNKTLSSFGSVIQIDILANPGLMGSPVLSQGGNVIGLISELEDTRFLPLAIPSSTILEYVHYSGASVEQSATDLLYREGLDRYWQGDYEGAQKKFSTVQTLFPYHSEATRLIHACEEKIGSNQRRKLYTFLISGLALLIMVVTLSNYLQTRRKLIRIAEDAGQS
jgi:S1-C subfamily serine protease